MNNIPYLIQLLESQYPENHQQAFDLIATSDEFPDDLYICQLLIKTPARLSKCIELGWLEHLEHLVYELTFSNQHLTTLPDNFSMLAESVFDVLLNHNQFSQFPPVLYCFQHINNLDLSNNQFQEFPDLQITPEPNNVSSTPDQLEETEEDTTLYSSPTSIDMSNNQITSIPDNISKLTSLYQLYLSNNNIAQLPNAIYKLTQLNNLHLYNNQLTSLSKKIQKLENLCELHLGHNQLTEVPKSMGKLLNLNWLDLSHNQLTELPKQVWLLLKKDYYFVELDLSYNQFTSLPPYLTKLLNIKKGRTQTSLSKLNLAGNPLQSFPDAILSIPELILPKEIPLKEQKRLQKLKKKQYKHSKLSFQ